MSSAKAKKPSDLVQGVPEAPIAPIKRIFAYPFEVHIFKQEGSAGVKGQVQRVNMMGFMVKLPSISYLSVNGNFIAKFELPGIDGLLQEEVKIIKTYQEIADRMFVAEIHFRHLSEASRAKIQEFTTRHKQRE